MHKNLNLHPGTIQVILLFQKVDMDSQFLSDPTYPIWTHFTSCLGVMWRENCIHHMCSCTRVTRKDIRSWSWNFHQYVGAS